VRTAVWLYDEEKNGELKFGKKCLVEAGPVRLRSHVRQSRNAPLARNQQFSRRGTDNLVTRPESAYSP